MSLIPTSAGFTTINLLNVNALYIQGQLFDSAVDAGLQAQIDAINAQLLNIDAVVDKFDVSGLPNPNLCVITTATTNQALKTLIDNINVDVSKLNQFDLSALPAAPPANVVITTATTNQALKALIDTNAGNITTLQNDVTSINNSITAINTKIAHWNNFTLGSDSMCGVNDGTGFAVALSGSASGNGIFVYPNTTSSTAQIQLASAQDKEILIRGGDAVKIYGGNDGSMTTRNVIDIGDVTDRIEIGRNQVVSVPPKYSLISIGVDTSIEGSASTTEVEGDIYFSSYSVYAPGLTPCLVAETTNPAKLGNTNNYTTSLNLTGLDVVETAGIITLTALVGGIVLTTGGGAMALNCGAGGFALSTGAGALSMNTGAGIMNLATSSAPIEMSTLTGNISIGPGKAVGGSAGNLSLNAAGNVIIQPDVATEIYKGAFLELNDNATAPPVTANRLYQQADALYWNGQLVQGGAGNQYVLKAGDTMTGTLVLPEAQTAILQLDNLTVAPTPVTNRLYLLNNVLTFNGTPVASGDFVLKTGDTMTGALTINYDAGNSTPQLSVVNTSNTAPVAAQGANIVLQNNATGLGSIGERCGSITFQADDNAGVTRSYSSIQSFVNDPTSTAIDGRLSHYVASNNTLTEMMRLISTSSAVRQANIAATSTTIGSTAIGSTATSTLTVQGTTNSTTSIQTPELNNCPAIYPAANNTLVDGAVKRYRPERVYKITDYPSPLSAPTIDGEKVIVLNSFGNPVSQVDSILQASDFPALSGGTFSNIVLSKYVDATISTPAMNIVAANYSNLLVHLFVQPDVAGVLSLTHVATFSINGQANVADFCVTTYSNKTRIYVGGGFSQIAIPAPNPVTVSVNNFSGRITITWGAGAVTNITHTAMLSASTSEDSSSFSGIDGVNNSITCVIDVTGNSGFAQPAVAGDKYDSIVIGGYFFSIGPGSPSPLYRPLQRLSYYDYSNASGGSQNLINQPTNAISLTLQAPTISFGTFNGNTLQTTYSGATMTASLQYLGGTPPQDTWAATVFQIRDSSQTVIIQSAQTLITTPATQTWTFGSFTLPAGTGNTYSAVLVITNWNNIPLQSVLCQADSNGAPYAILTADITTVPIGWRPFQSANWATPEGPDGVVFGGGLCSSGYLAFAYEGTQVITATTPLVSNSIFSVYYTSGTASWNVVNDEDLIQSGGGGSSPDQTWNYTGRNVNCVTGGNPVLAYGAGNAYAYDELYFNTGYSVTSQPGVSFRRTPQDPYEMTDSLVIDGVSGASLASNQLIGQFGSQICYSVYRDDSKYTSVYFIARGTLLDTAVPPFINGVPTYNTILNAGAAIPCFTFGGYSDEVGYTGALFATNTNLYVYKLGAGGELVIDLSGCTVRTFNDVTPSAPILATNKLTFPTNTDGGSVTLCGDTSTTPASWWAISQDGPLYYDNTLIGGSGNSGVTDVSATTGISVSAATGHVTIGNTGVTSIVAGTNVTISSTGTGGTGEVTINATSTQSNGYIKMRCPLLNILNQIDNAVHTLPTAPSLDFLETFKTGLGVNFDTGGPGSQLRWTGTGWVMVTITFNVGVSFFNATAQSNINLLEYKNGHYENANFGLQIYVNDESGNISNRNPNTTAWFIGSNSVYTNAVGNIALSPPNYQNSVTYTCLLNTNYSINVTYLTNAYFNSSGSGATVGDLSATFFPSEWAFTIVPTGAPDH